MFWQKQFVSSVENGDANTENMSLIRGINSHHTPSDRPMEVILRPRCAYVRKN